MNVIEYMAHGPNSVRGKLVLFAQYLGFIECE